MISILASESMPISDSRELSWYSEDARACSPSSEVVGVGGRQGLECGGGTGRQRQQIRGASEGLRPDAARGGGLALAQHDVRVQARGSLSGDAGYDGPAAVGEVLEGRRHRKR